MLFLCCGYGEVETSVFAWFLSIISLASVTRSAAAHIANARLVNILTYT